jgi:hypothetical protein
MPSAPYISFFHSLQLPLPDHVHDFKALQGSPSGLKGEKVHSWDAS